MGKTKQNIVNASGNLMATEKYTGIPHFENNPLVLDVEYPIYGSSRVGIKNYKLKIQETTADDNTYYLIDDNAIENVFTRKLNLKNYELSNHLGNVLVTVSDRKIGHDDGLGGFTYYTADVTSAQDYYPFGMVMPGRSFSTPEYRFGFNGKEKDDEASGTGNQYDYGFRIYNPRIAKFLSVDPLTMEFPWNSTYAFAENSPIAFIDLEGLERFFAADGSYLGKLGTSNQVRVVKDAETFNTIKSAETDYARVVRTVVMSSVFHNSSPEIQAKIVTTIYKREIGNDINSVESVSPLSEGEAANNYGVGQYKIDGSKTEGSEYLFDDYHNIENIMYHEKLHNDDRVAGRQMRDDAEFIHFDIGMREVGHESFAKMNNAGKSFIKEIMTGYLDAQEAWIEEEIVLNGKSLDDMKGYINWYNSNVDKFNKSFDENYSKEDFNVAANPPSNE